MRTAIPAWTPKHLQTCWPGQKRTSQNRSARQKRRNSAHFEVCDRRHHLLAVAQAGSMAKAGRDLAIWQSAISRAIADMEHTFGEVRPAKF
ncbi:MAG TPA: LysR family transcriptional regulator [Xanthobacteraceae bacterium]|nr:LysR family transcriptional regulator [Xanthobacteraceae bacterium]